jgi:hypothetical protein
MERIMDVDRFYKFIPQSAKKVTNLRAKSNIKELKNTQNEFKNMLMSISSYLQKTTII